MTRRDVCSCLAPMLAVAWVASPAAGLDPLTPGTLVVAVDEFTGLNTAPTYLAEYTVGGTLVQELADLPVPQPPSIFNDPDARDVVVGPGDAVHVLNGRRPVVLNRFDLATEQWAQPFTDTLDVTANLTYGGIDRFGGFLFASNTGPAGGAARFDPTDGTARFFADGLEFRDLDAGPDGVVYGIEPGVPRDRVHRFDALTLEPLGTVPVPPDEYTGVGVWTDGSIFLLTGDAIRRFAPDGTLLDELTGLGGNRFDLDIDAQGRIATGSAFVAEVTVTDIALDAFVSFPVGPLGPNNNARGDLSVAWTDGPVPEPAAALAVLSGLAVLTRRRAAR